MPAQRRKSSGSPSAERIVDPSSVNTLKLVTTPATIFSGRSRERRGTALDHLGLKDRRPHLAAARGGLAAIDASGPPRGRRGGPRRGWRTATAAAGEEDDREDREHAQRHSRDQASGEADEGERA